MFYEFDIPPSLVGRLIGRYGTFVNKIKSLSGANVLVKRHSKTNSLRTCAVEGEWKSCFIMTSMAYGDLLY